ncbi:MAG: biopolymer transporter ExbD [Marinilabiliales bacterium]|nr:biopolymer transporter ExbD [Marinilabiliales bacterium]
MPKVKIPRKSTAIDMTAMCDVAFLLLTFFMLTSNFTKKEATTVHVPTSISELKIPERNVMLILVDQEGKIFFGIDGQENRMEVLKKMGSEYHLDFTQEELKQFSLVNSFGLSAGSLKRFLAASDEAREAPGFVSGIPADSLNNQLRSWVIAARSTKPEYRITIKADQKTPYPAIKHLMDLLQDLKENRYNLITTLETASDLQTEQK